MKFSTESPKNTLYAVMQSIKQDKKSWQDWFFLQIETAAPLAAHHRKQLDSELKKAFKTYLGEGNKETDVLYEDTGKIGILCRHVSEHVLKDIGRHIQDYMARTAHIAIHVAVFDIFRDSESLVSHYPFTDFLHAPSPQYKETQADGVLHHSYDFEVINPDHPKVLLVEDDPVTRWVVRTALKGTCHLATAQEADHAIRLYQTYKPDIVFLDINLPGKSGQEVLAILMKMDPGAHIIMFSSHDGVDNILSTMEIGAKGFIAKPFNKEKLLYYIGKCSRG